MQQKLQFVFEETLELQDKRGVLAEMYKDALENSKDYIELGDQIKALREKRKVIEVQTMEKMGGTIDDLKMVKEKIEMDKDTMSAFVYGMILEGEKLEEIIVKDGFDNEYTPQIKVNFKKKK
jgi:hypothetical protein